MAEEPTPEDRRHATSDTPPPAGARAVRRERDAADWALALVAIVVAALIAWWIAAWVDTDTDFNATIGEITSDPEDYYGQFVNVVGTVGSTSPAALAPAGLPGATVGFTIRRTGTADELLVVDAGGEGFRTLTEGRIVEVSGFVRQFDATVFNAGNDVEFFNDEFFSPFDGRPVIVASSIDRTLFGPNAPEGFVAPATPTPAPTTGQATTDQATTPRPATTTGRTATTGQTTTPGTTTPGQATTGATTGGTTGGTAAPGATIATERNQRLGTFLVDDDGRAVYLFEQDSGQQGSTCYDACAAAWPPVTTTADPQAAGAADASLLSTIERRTGETQVVYDGHPLYYYAPDSRTTVLGQGLEQFGAPWYVVAPSGEAIEQGGS